MFSGGDSSGDGVNSLNQYSNFRLPGQGAGNGNGSIDWALLAAQWIQMRDNSTSNLDVGANMGIMSEIPPPPPSISITDINYQMVKSMNEQQQLSNIKKTDIPTTTPTTSTNIKKTAYEEKGEADMDMDDDDDFANSSIAKESKFEPSSPPPPAPSMQLSNASAVAPPVGIMQPPHWYVQQQQASVQLPTPINIAAANIAGNNANALPWPAWPPRMSVPPPSTATTITGPTIPSVPSGSAVSGVPSNVNVTAHIPSLMKLNVANPNVMKTMSNTQPEIDPNALPPIDTAKRKILPAWIREGLEKMEREKQKQMERQLQQNNVISHTETLNEVSVQSPNLVNELTVKHKTTNSLESGASSGNDDDEPDDRIDVHHTKGIIKAQQQITIHRNSDSEAEYELTSKQKTSAIDNLNAHLDDDVANKKNNDTIIDGDVDEDAVEEQQVSKGYEERLADLMIIVRRTLTELLLEVTNNEISSIAQEAIKSQKIKASSAQVIRKSALSSITGKLGLAAYANTSSDEDSDASDDDKSDHDEKDVDSEEEIKATIRQKRRNFSKISEEIEERVSANAQREEQKLKYYTQVERQQSEMTSDGNPKRGDQDRTGDIDAERYGDSERRGAASASDVGKGFEREFGETTTETKLPHSNGKRSKLEHSKRKERKERTTRFSDNKDNKATSLAYITQIQKQQQQQSQHQQHQNSAVASTSSTNIPLKPTVTAADALNSLYTMPAIYNTTHSTSGINTMLSAAELALEKASAKQKSSSSSSSTHKRRHSLKRQRQRHSSERDKRKQRRSRSSTSTSTTTSSTSSSSTTSSSSSSSTTTPSERSRSNGSRRRDGEHHKHHSSSKHHKRSHSRSRSSNKQQQQQQQQKHASSSSSSYDRKRLERSRYETHSRHRHQRSRRHSSGSDDHRDYRKSRSRSRSPYTSSSSRHRRRHH